MIRVHVVCEGQTEQTFVSKILANYRPDLLQWFSTLSGKSYQKPRGGDVRWERVLPDLLRTLKQDREAIVTTMFDFYALGQGFPNRQGAIGRTPQEKAGHVERGMSDVIAGELDYYWNRRFVPYIQMHEFEALLFSHPDIFADALYAPHLGEGFQNILRAAGGDPEGINDSPHTAPSKRIEAVFPCYDKILYGNLAAEVIGLPRLRQTCTHFGDWIARIEQLAEQMEGIAPRG